MDIVCLFHVLIAHAYDLQFAGPSFFVVMPTGVKMPLAELIATASPESGALWHLESITVAKSRDLATALFWMGDEEAVTFCTAALSRGISDQWTLECVQCSNPIIPAQAVPGGLPVKLTL